MITIDHIKNLEESILENNLIIIINKWKTILLIYLKIYRHERSLILLLSLTDSNILKQAGFTDSEIKIIKNIALEKIHRQKSLKE